MAVHDTQRQTLDPAPAAGEAARPAEGQLDNSKRSRSKLGSRLWAAAGLLCFGVGCIGVVLPILPTTPFILVAAFCFARASERVDRWFRSTKVYKQVLEGYVTKKRMTAKAKLSIIVPVTVLLGIAVFFMRNVPVWAGVLVVVWLVHLVYFGLVIPTDREGSDPRSSAGPAADQAAE